MLIEDMYEIIDNAKDRITDREKQIHQFDESFRLICKIMQNATEEEKEKLDTALTAISIAKGKYSDLIKDDQEHIEYWGNKIKAEEALLEGADQ